MGKNSDELEQICKDSERETSPSSLMARRRLGAEASVPFIMFRISVYIRDPHDKG